MFLDFTGGAKPYVLNEMDNHMGAVTRVEYRPSTHYYLEDQKKSRHALAHTAPLSGAGRGESRSDRRDLTGQADY